MHKIFLLAVVSLTVAPLAGAQGTCGLDARNSYNVALPDVQDGQVSAPLLAEIRRGFEMVSISFQVPEGEQVLLRARDQAVAQKNECAEALASFGLGQAARSIRLPDALPRFLRAEELLRSGGTPLALALVHQRVVTTRYVLGDRDRFNSDNPLVIEELHQAGDEAGAVMQRSLAVQYSGKPSKPEDFEKLFEELAAVKAPNAVMVRGYLQYLQATALRRVSQYRASMEHYKAAAESLKSCDCGLSTLGSVYLDMGLISSEDNDAAATMTYAQEGDRIFRKIHLEAYRAQSLRMIGTAYGQMGDHARAISTMEQALQVAREQKANYAIPDIGVKLATFYSESGDPLKGLAVLNETRVQPESHAGKCLYEISASQLYLDANLASRGDEAVRDALKNCGDLLQGHDLLAVDYLAGAIFLQEGLSDEALTYAQRSVDGVEKLRNEVGQTDRNQTGFNDSHAEYYEGLIAALTKLHRNEDALMVSELYHARPFRDLVNSMQAGAVAPGKATDLNLSSEAHDFDLTIADIRSMIERQHATLVSYWFHDKRLYIWVIAPGQPVFETDAALDAASLEKMVKAVLPAETSGSRRGNVLTRGGGSVEIAKTGRKPWSDLYRVLIGPIAAHIPQTSGSLLTIVPQGPLFKVSFPALMDADGHYLIERYAINTVPSAGTLQLTGKNETASAGLPARYLLVANPERYPSVDGRPLPPLPGTDAEVRGISKYLGKDVTMLEGRQAGIDNMIASLGQVTTLHLATHAVMSDDAPMKSFLALDRSQRGGMLTTASVYGLKLHTGLVVLSACSTGRGKITGDGVAGLSRAFFYAGAASLVTTLWDVVDAPTAELMPRFYAGLAKGESRSVALRHAQLDLIQSLRQNKVRMKTLAGTTESLPENPAYWAAFSLSGQP